MSGRPQSLTWLLSKLFYPFHSLKLHLCLRGFLRQIHPSATMSSSSATEYEPLGGPSPLAVCSQDFGKTKKSSNPEKHGGPSFIGETPWLSVPALRLP